MPQQPAFPPETLGARQHPQDRQTAFVYPYNFVPHGGPRKSDSQPQGMGADQRFKRLDRFDGLTGRIEYTLTALSPLFVADSEGTTVYERPPEDGEERREGEKHRHRVMDFFNVRGRLCLPGTSIKGVLRTMLEALSNSSFGVFTPEITKFKFRKVMDLDRQDRSKRDLTSRKWGRWQAGGAIEPLEVGKIWREGFDNTLGLTNDDQRIHEYNRLRAHHSVVHVDLWQLHTGSPHVQAFTGAFAGTVFNNVMTTVRRGELRPRQGFKSEILDGNQRYKGPILSLLRDRLRLRGDGPWTVQFKTISDVPNGQLRGREERVCWIETNGQVWTAHIGAKDVLLWPRKGWKDMTLEQRAQSHYIAALYPSGGRPLLVREEARQAYRDTNDGKLPQPGDIVRYYERGGQVVEFGPVAMFKTPEQATVKEIAEQTPHILRCEANDKLCPASRLFGWTPEDESQQDEEKFPVAGRVRVSIAWSNKTLADTCLLPLQILGSPKPQYYPFYLRPMNVDASSRTAYYATPQQEGGWWHRAGVLRGRKFYLHHPQAVGTDPALVHYAELTADKVSPKTRENDPNWRQSHQNSTCAVLPGGAIFRGVIEFESLDPYELGLLLWAMTFSDAPLQESQHHAHKLGMGKGIGLGSVRFHLEGVTVQAPEKSWVDLEHSENDSVLETVHERRLDADELAELVRRFKTWMVSGADADDPGTAAQYDASAYVQDLLAVTRVHLVPQDVPIQYYPPNWRDDRNSSVRKWFSDEGFTYFVHQRQRRASNAEEPLRTPAAIDQGYRQGESLP